MQEIPRDLYPDSTIPMRLDPYDFVAKRCRRNLSDLFRSRLLLRPTVYMLGESAAELFNNEKYFQRSGAAPLLLQKTLFGRGGIQTVDDEEHKRRKQLFLSILYDPTRISSLKNITFDLLKLYAHRWTTMDSVVLYDEFQEILTQAVCVWAGIPLQESEVKKRTRQLTQLFDRAGSPGIGHFMARFSRSEAERWISALVSEVRLGRSVFKTDSAAHKIALYRTGGGELLEAQVAAVEILNILRPTVAISVYAVFCILATHTFPQYRDSLKDPTDEFAELFVQEVRRFYPFFPSTIAKVRKDFEWNEYTFSKGWTAVLDLYGTNHDPRIWKQPFEFNPVRFREKTPSYFGFIPQGGGDRRQTHRCPGEAVTTELMKLITTFFAHCLTYQVPAQNLEVNKRRLPALPQSHLVISQVENSATCHKDFFREQTKDFGQEPLAVCPHRGAR